MHFSLLLLPLLLSLACEEERDPSQPEGTLHLLRDAVLDQDTTAILANCSATTHQTLAQLHTLLKEQRIAIEEKYPKDQRELAYSAYPEGILEAEDSAALFAALIQKSMSELSFDEGLKYGLTRLGRSIINESRATVSTHSGESIEMILEEGKWKSTVFERALEQNLNKVRLNQQTLEENLKVFGEMKRKEETKKAAALGNSEKE